MSKSIDEIQETLIQILRDQLPILKVREDKHENFEVAGTIEAMQGKKKVDGIYFASVRPKPKDIRFYFFPIYTHADAFSDISAGLRKCLKGKSCFHIKKLDETLENDIRQMVEKGINLYKQDKLL